MRWRGEVLKRVVTQKNLTQEAFSAKVGVTRQTFIEWTKGQVPKGNHLLALCRVLAVAPASLFTEDVPLMVPAHRTRRKAKRTAERDVLAAQLAAEYVPLFDGVPAPALLPSCPPGQDEDASAVAGELRRIAGMGDPGRPMDHEHACRLLDRLGVCLIVRTFPAELKDYAFYTRVGVHRCVFVNGQTNVLDLIYPLLHEAAHAIRDTEETPPAEYSQEEEDFCEAVANAAQFPCDYIEQARQLLRGKSAAIQVNTLKTLATQNHHAAYGLYKALTAGSSPTLALAPAGIHGADGNLRKISPAVRENLHAATAEAYIVRLSDLSPYLVRVLRAKAGSITLRTLVHLLDLDSVLDARQVRDLLREPAANARPV